MRWQIYDLNSGNSLPKRIKIVQKLLPLLKWCRFSIFRCLSSNKHFIRETCLKTRKLCYVNSPLIVTENFLICTWFSRSRWIWYKFLSYIIRFRIWSFYTFCVGLLWNLVFFLIIFLILICSKYSREGIYLRSQSSKLSLFFSTLLFSFNNSLFKHYDYKWDCSWFLIYLWWISSQNYLSIKALTGPHLSLSVVLRQQFTCRLNVNKPYCLYIFPHLYPPIFHLLLFFLFYFFVVTLISAHVVFLALCS